MFDAIKCFDYSLYLSSEWSKTKQKVFKNKFNLNFANQGKNWKCKVLFV